MRQFRQMAVFKHTTGKCPHAPICLINRIEKLYQFTLWYLPYSDCEYLNWVIRSNKIELITVKLTCYPGVFRNIFPIPFFRTCKGYT